uniref:Uncharacterized protein n=1 Tax=Ascaris lumbricoides TaxID=6252 RepID=A0A0M3HS67_ASCLU
MRAPSMISSCRDAYTDVPRYASDCLVFPPCRTISAQPTHTVLFARRLCHKGKAAVPILFACRHTIIVQYRLVVATFCVTILAEHFFASIVVAAAAF